MDGLSLHEPSSLSKRNPVTSPRAPNSPSLSASSKRLPGESLPAQYRNSVRGLNRRSSNQTIRSNANSVAGDDHPEILAPQPRRHLIENSTWLRAQSQSPVSMRAVSPATSQTFSHDPSSRMSIGRRTSLRHQSFSSIQGLSKIGSSQKTSQHELDVGMGRRWLRWMEKQGMKDWIVPGAIVVSLYLKWCLGLGSHSGKNSPPLFGDYEAQRHWMEITNHLPVKQWYTYDLQYWGLDYPPLTAYHSWLCGLIGSWLNPSWFSLDDSRGLETSSSQVYMRSTALASDTLIYLPAVLMFVKTWHVSRSRRTQNLALLTLLFQPALLLIDFGHFQFNSVMLSFTLLSLNFLASGNDILGAVFFVLSLGFKQMALYYAPAVGSYLVAKCIHLGPAEGSRLFLRLALTTVMAFVLLFAPFLPPFSPLLTVLHPITRIFPFDRGLFEDKVSNFWCASNVVLKWKNIASPGLLVKISTVFTALGFAPGVTLLLRTGFQQRAASGKPEHKASPRTSPMLPLLVYVLLTSSLSFFLFSFQVHEKSILLPLLPMTLLMSSSAPTSSTFLWGALMNNMAMFSMWPLLKRDGLGVQYLVMLALWNRLLGYNPFAQPKRKLIHLLSAAANTSAIVIHAMELLFSPPARYPDLYPVLNVLVTTPVFGFCLLWSIKSTVQIAWALQGPGTTLKREGAGLEPKAATSDKQLDKITVRPPLPESFRSQEEEKDRTS